MCWKCTRRGFQKYSMLSLRSTYLITEYLFLFLH